MRGPSRAIRCDRHRSAAIVIGPQVYVGPARPQETPGGGARAVDVGIVVVRRRCDAETPRRRGGPSQGDPRRKPERRGRERHDSFSDRTARSGARGLGRSAPLGHITGRHDPGLHLAARRRLARLRQGAARRRRATPCRGLRRPLRLPTLFGRRRLPVLRPRRSWLGVLRRVPLRARHRSARQPAARHADSLAVSRLRAVARREHPGSRLEPRAELDGGRDAGRAGRRRRGAQLPDRPLVQRLVALVFARRRAPCLRERHPRPGCRRLRHGSRHRDPADDRRRGHDPGPRSSLVARRPLARVLRRRRRLRGDRRLRRRARDHRLGLGRPRQCPRSELVARRPFARLRRRRRPRELALAPRPHHRRSRLHQRRRRQPLPPRLHPRRRRRRLCAERSRMPRRPVLGRARVGHRAAPHRLAACRPDRPRVRLRRACDLGEPRPAGRRARPVLRAAALQRGGRRDHPRRTDLAPQQRMGPGAPGPARRRLHGDPSQLSRQRRLHPPLAARQPLPARPGRGPGLRQRRRTF